MTDFQRLIIDWYRLNKRDLPWRQTKNPYYIWLSEIILQQTRVAQGLDYYMKFIKHYPSIFDLANAEEEDILNDWQGLGYYSRARNLHTTAKKIACDLGGIFPEKYDEIIKLKGIGDYTAAAISSFAFDLPYSVVDGNVYRVLSRVFDIELPIDSTIGKNHFSNFAQELLPKKNAAEYNQAIMEFGALQCVTNSPICNSCPLLRICLASQNKTIAIRPVKEKKTKIRNRYFHFMIFKENNKIALVKREKNDIWKHLYHFPLIETENEIMLDEINRKIESKFKIKPIKNSEIVKHILSHQKIFARFYFFDKFPSNLPLSYKILPVKNIQDFPMPRLIDKFLDETPI